MSDRETMGRLAQEAYSERLRKDRPSGWIAGWADYGPSGQEAWRCVAEALQQARDTAQAAQLRVLEIENGALKTDNERFKSFMHGHRNDTRDLKSENERLRGLLKVAVGHHRSDCPCPCCKAVGSPAVKPAETIGPTDDDETTDA